MEEGLGNVDTLASFWGHKRLPMASIATDVVGSFQVVSGGESGNKREVKKQGHNSVVPTPHQHQSLASLVFFLPKKNFTTKLVTSGAGGGGGGGDTYPSMWKLDGFSGLAVRCEGESDKKWETCTDGLSQGHENRSGTAHPPFLIVLLL